MWKWILALLLVAASPVWAATYFVSQTGNDVNDGSAPDDAHAWATISHAGQFSTGVGPHTINVSGTITEASSILLNSGANSWNGKTLTFVGGTGAALTGNINANGLFQLPAAGFAATGSFNFQNLDITNTNATNARIFLWSDVASTVSMAFTGCDFVNTASTANVSLIPSATSRTWGFSFTNCTFTTNGAVYLGQSAGDVTFDTCTLNTTKNDGFGIIDLTYADPAGAVAVYGKVTIKGCTFLAPNQAHVSGAGSIRGSFLDAGLIVIQGNTFGSSGSRVQSNSVMLNSLTDSGALNVTVERNTFWHNCSVANVGPVLLGSSADVAPDTDTDGNLNRFTGIVVIGNVMNGSGAVAGNAVYMHIGPEVSNGGIIAQNSIVGRQDYDIGLYLHGQPATAKPLLVIDNSLSCRSALTLVGANNCVLAYNTGWQNQGIGTTAPIIIRDGNGGSPEPSANVFYGNIAAAAGTAHTALEYESHAGAITPSDLYVWNHFYDTGTKRAAVEANNYATQVLLDGYWDDLSTISRLNDSRLYAGTMWGTGDPLFVSPSTGRLDFFNGPAAGTKTGIPRLWLWNDKGAWQRRAGSGSGILINPTP